MDYTFATVIVAAADKEAALALLTPEEGSPPGYFTAGYSADGQEPVTHYVSAGPFSNKELDLLVNDTTTTKKVLFGREPRLDGLVAVPPKLEP